MIATGIPTLLICGISTANAQSDTTLTGMAAYNSGNFDEAFRLLSEASAAGDPEAHANLGYLYVRGHGVAVNRNEAVRLYRLSAEADSSEGMNALAVNYQGGTTLPRDLEQAAYWYCEAVIRGSARAMNNLALLLVSGEIEVDVAEARNLWEQAAEFGNANGMYNLGISYRYGDDANVALADDWMMRGAQAGHEGAQQSVRRNGYNGSLPPPVLPGLEMRPEPKGATGRTKECGLYLS